MNKFDAERAIMLHRPGEPFVLVEFVEGDEIEDLSALSWQAKTEPPSWQEVEDWVAHPPMPPANLEAADELRAKIVADNLKASGAPHSLLEATYESFHSQAQSGIPWYESFTGPDVAAAWAKFQALDAATQQRIMFNLCRTVAAMMRFMTGHLPYVDQGHAEGIAVPSGTDLTDFIDAAAATAVATPDGVDVYGQTFSD